MVYKYNIDDTIDSYDWEIEQYPVMRVSASVASLYLTKNATKVGDSIQGALTIYGGLGVAKTVYAGERVVSDGLVRANKGVGVAMNTSNVVPEMDGILAYDTTTTTLRVSESGQWNSVSLQGATQMTVSGDFVVNGKSIFTNGIELLGGLTSQQPVLLKSDLEVTGQSQFDGGITAQGTNLIEGTLDITGPSTFEGGFTAEGPSVFKSVLQVDGSSVMNGAITVNGKGDFETGIIVRGSTGEFQTGLVVWGKSEMRGGFTSASSGLIKQDLVVQGASDLLGLTVEANALVKNGLTVVGTLRATGDALMSNMTITGKSVLNGGITMGQNALIKGLLNVEQDTNLAGFTAQNASYIKNSLTVRDNLSVETGLIQGENMYITGASTMGETLFVTGFTAQNEAWISGLTVGGFTSEGVSLFKDQTLMDQGFTVNGGSLMNGMVDMNQGFGALSGSINTVLNVGGTLSVEGPTMLDGFTVEQKSLLKNGFVASDSELTAMTVTGNALMKGTTTALNLIGVNSRFLNTIQADRGVNVSGNPSQIFNPGDGILMYDTTSGTLKLSKGGTFSDIVGPTEIGTGGSVILGTNITDLLIQGLTATKTIVASGGVMIAANSNTFAQPIRDGIIIYDSTDNQLKVSKDSAFVPLSLNFRNLSIFEAQNNVLTPQPITGLAFDQNEKSFGIWLNVDITAYQNKHAIFSIRGLWKDTNWSLNTEYYGDETGIEFSIDSQGQLYYMSPNMVGFVSLTFSFYLEAGGWSTSLLSNIVANAFTSTGNIQVNGSATVAGNALIGGDAKFARGVIVSSSAFANPIDGTVIYDTNAKELKVAKDGSFVSISTTDTNPNPTSQLISFAASNGVNIATPVTGLIFADERYFSIMVNVEINRLFGGNLNSLYELVGVKTDTSWSLEQTAFGDETGIVFTMDSSGQIYYQSPNYDYFASAIFTYPQQTSLNSEISTGNMVIHGSATVEGAVVVQDTGVFKKGILISGTPTLSPQDGTLIYDNADGFVKVSKGGNFLPLEGVGTSSALSGTSMSALFVSGQATFGSNVEISGTAKANTLTSQRLTVATFTNVGASVFQGGFTSNGDSLFSGNVDVLGALSVDQLNITGSTPSVFRGFTTTSDVLMEGDLNVIGKIWGNDMEMQGTVSSSTVLASTVAASTLNVSGTVQSTAAQIGDLVVTGNDLVMGDTTHEGATVMQGGFTSGTDALVVGDLDITNDIGARNFRSWQFTRDMPANPGDYVTVATFESEANTYVPISLQLTVSFVSDQTTSFSKTYMCTMTPNTTGIVVPIISYSEYNLALDVDLNLENLCFNSDYYELRLRRTGIVMDLGTSKIQVVMRALYIPDGTAINVTTYNRGLMPTTGSTSYAVATGLILEKTTMKYRNALTVYQSVNVSSTNVGGMTVSGYANIMGKLVMGSGGGTSNLLDFLEVSGQRGYPSTSNRSAGTRINLYGTGNNNAIGIGTDNSTWISGSGLRLFNGVDGGLIASISATGNMVIQGLTAVSNLNVVGTVQSASVNVSGTIFGTAMNTGYMNVMGTGQLAALNVSGPSVLTGVSTHASSTVLQGGFTSNANSLISQGLTVGSSLNVSGMMVGKGVNVSTTIFDVGSTQDGTLIFDTTDKELKVCQNGTYIPILTSNLTTFSASNNVFPPQPITNLSFTNSQYFAIMVNVDIYKSVGSNLHSLYELVGVKKDSAWTLSQTSFGDDAGVNFSIDSSGLVYYDTIYYSNFVSASFTFPQRSPKGGYISTGDINVQGNMVITGSVIGNLNVTGKITGQNVWDTMTLRAATDLAVSATTPMLVATDLYNTLGPGTFLFEIGWTGNTGTQRYWDFKASFSAPIAGSGGQWMQNKAKSIQYNATYTDISSNTYLPTLTFDTNPISGGTYGSPSLYISVPVTTTLQGLYAKTKRLM